MISSLPLMETGAGAGAAGAGVGAAATGAIGAAFVVAAGALPR